MRLQARATRIRVIEGSAKRFAPSVWRVSSALLLLICLALLPQGQLFAASGPTRIQSNTAKGNYTASLPITFTNPTTSGDHLVVAVVDYYPTDGSPFSVTDNKGNTWKTAVDYANGSHIIVFYAENIIGGAGHVVTVKASTASYFNAAAVEYSGVASGNSLDVVAKNRASGLNYTSTPVTITTGSELLFGVHRVPTTGVTFTPTAPWSTVATVANYDQTEIQDQVAPTASSYASTGTESTSNDTQSVVVAFRGVWTGGVPVISSFTASPTAILNGQSSALSWSVAGATSVSIDSGVGTVSLSGSTNVTPSAPTTYTLTATNDSGSVTAQATVTVSFPPVITSFTAAPSPIFSGQSSTLSWATTGATTVSISPGVGTVAASGTANVSPTATTVYTITATNSGGTVTSQATVTVTPPPTITSFTASPATILTGQSSTLSWTVTGADTVSIDQSIGAVAATGSKSVTPSATTQYTLTATNGAGTVTAKTTVTVNAAPPPVISSVQSSNITGAAATITWNTDVASDSQVEYGTDATYGSSSTLNTSLVTAHSVTLSNLQGATTYHYRVKSKNSAGSLGVSADFTFTTLPASGGSTPVRIQSKGGIGNSGASLAITFNNPTTSGNQLVVAVVDYYATDGSPFSVTDNKGNTWKTAVDYSNGAHIIVFYAENITGGAGHVVTVKANTASYFNAAAVEYSGIASGNSLDVVAKNRASGPNYTSTPVTIATGSELLFGVHRVPATGVTFTPATPWNTVTSLTNYDETQIQDQVAAAAGSYASTGTESSSNDTVSVVVAFRGVYTGGAPVISSFTASPTGILNGQSSTLAWSVAGATSVSIDQNIGTVNLSGSTTVTPAATTTYTLTATNSTGTVTAQATVTVSFPPVITSFTAAPSPIFSGQSSTLTWATTGATTVSIDHGVGTVAASGTANVSPTTTTVYTISATNAGGTVTSQATVTVTPPPTITSFTASPASILTGQSSTLSWNVTGADTVSIDQSIGAVAATGSKSVTPSATTQYTLTATNGAGTVTAKTTVTVNAAPPPVISSVQSSNINGSSATITWTTDVTSDSQVEYGLDATYGTSSTLNASLVTSHSVVLSGLQGSTTYHYRVKSKNSAGSLGVSIDYSFTTLPASGGSNPVRIQSKNGIGNSSASLPITFTSPTTSGNQLVVAVVDYYPTDGAPFSVTDNKGNTWKTAVDYSNGAHIIVFYAENITGGSGHIVTVKANTASYFNAVAVEYSGLAAANSLDVVTKNRASGASYTSTAATTTTGSELLFGVHRIPATGVTFTPTAPWSAVTTVSNYDETEVQDQVVSSIASYASTGTQSSSNDTVSVMVGFRGVWTGGVPVISSFSASPTAILNGQSSVLSWNVAGADTVSIDSGIGSVGLSGSTNVSPTATKTYTLTATNSSGTVTAQATVTVSFPPVITSFTAAPSPIFSGQSSTLNWATTGATTVSIDHGVGTVAASGTANVTPTTTTVYTISATNTAGTVTSQATVTVTPPPTVTSFTASPASVLTGQSSTLSWNVTGADTVSIDQSIGAVAATGSKSVTPSATTQYTLTATNAAGTVTSKTTVTVNAAPPPVITNVQSGNINGSSATITWTTDTASDSQVEYGLDATYGASSTLNASMVTSHSVVLVGLQGATTYHYCVKSKNSAGSLGVSTDFTFTTLPASGGSTPVRIQSKSGIGNYASTLPLSFTSPTTSGNQLVVALVVYYANDGVPFTITDNKGNTWKTAADYVNGCHIIVFYAENITGGAGHVITVNASNASYFNAAAMEYSGIASTNSLDVVARNRASDTNYTSSSATLSGGNELLLGIHRISNTGVVFTPASPWNTVTTLTNYDQTQVQDRVAATAGSYASTGVENSFNDTVSVMVAFRGVWPGGVPVISSFTANPTSILAGQSSTLAWTVAGADTVSIDSGVGTVASTGSTSVTPATTTVYTLTAINASGTVTAQTTVNVPTPPIITSFTATPSTIPSGQSSTLAWSVAGANTISISPGIGTVAASSSVAVNPSATTVYTITAINAIGTVTAQATVTVTPPPAITSFTASPTSINSGQSSTLTWATTGATTISIDHGVGTVAATGSTSVTPAATTVYTITATNASGTVTAQATVTVTPLPTITSFTATPASIPATQSSTLAWTTTGATTVSIDHSVGAVAATASIAVNPSATTTYTLTATNAAGTVTAQATVTVLIPPTITSFTAAPTSINGGQSSTLTWATTGAPTTVSIDHGIGTVAASGSTTVTPSATTVYTITATNAGGTVTAQATVTVTPQPIITSFTAAPASVPSGQSSTLTWATTGNATVSIDHGVGTVAASGSTTVTPSATTIYTITATNAAGTVTAQATVTVLIPPSITSFTAAPTSINGGQSSTLTWATTGGDTVSIDHGIGTVAASGSVAVTPAATTVYTITATNAGGTVTAQATVTVTPLPVITSFTASPSPILGGQSSTLAWTVTSADTVSIDQSIGTVAATGSKTVTPAATTVYTLTATNAAGTVTAQTTVTVTLPPTITNFTATPASINGGQSSTLSWTITGNATVTIDSGVGTVASTGSKTITPATTTTYTLTATNAAGTVTAQAIVTVTLPPTITSFTASPSLPILNGQSGTLSWTTNGGDTVTIDHGIGTVAASSSTTVTPAANTTYTLTTTNAAGTVTAHATVLVNAAPPPVITSVQPSNLTGVMATITWTTDVNSDSQVEYGIDANYGATTTLNASPVTSHSVALMGLMGSTTYHYRVRSTDATGDLAISDDFTFTTLPPSGGSTPVRIQSKSGSGTSTASLPVTFDNPTTSGNQLVVALATADPAAGAPFSVTDDHGNIWKTAADYANGSHILVFYAENIHGGSGHTITVTASAPVSFNVAAVEYSGMSSTGSFDVTASNRATGASYTSTPVTLVVGNELLFGVHRVPGAGVTFTPATPWNAVTTVTGADELEVQDQLAASAGSYASTGVESSANDTASVVVAFRGVWTGPPAIPSFTASPAAILSGQGSTLSWNVVGPTSVSIDTGIGTVAAVGSMAITPAVTTTYTITATNASGTTTAQTTVMVTPPPTITSFGAAPSTIQIGQNSTLSWSVAGATSVLIAPGVGTVAATGSVTVTPSATTVYTISAMNAAGTVTSQATVTVLIPPTITSFTANPSTTPMGQSSTLSWATSGATTVSIDHGVGSVATIGSVAVTPAATTTYTLTAMNADGTVTAQTTVIVTPPPTITSFSAGPSTIQIGQNSTLSWVTSGATTISIDHGVGTVAATGSASVTPSVTTVYTISAMNAAGAVTSQATVTVLIPPTITSFTANPTTTPIGQSSTLSWATTGATTVSIDHGVGTVATTGSVAVSPTATTTYTLTATNADGTVTAQTIVTVLLQPTITSFTAAPSTIQIGQNSTLTWAISGATTISIDHGIGTVAATGSVAVTPSATTVYTISATNAAGTVTSQATVTVLIPPTITSFTANPASTPTSQSSTLSWATTGSTTVSIDHGVGTVATTGSVAVSPTTTTTYTLTATNADGTVTAQTTVTIILPPTITSFTAAPSPIIGGQSSTLSWNTTGGATISIDHGVGAVAAIGSQSVTPATTTTYTLTVTNAAGTLTSQATVTVTLPPTITSFTATPAAIYLGQSSALAWNTSGAATVSIDTGIGTVAATGSTSVTPSATTVYTITATNAAGTLTAQATITVTPPPPPTISGPHADVTGASATISWTTDVDSDSRVEFGLDATYGNLSALGSALVPSHSVTVTGLLGSTTYHYRVKSRNFIGDLTVSSDFTFTTLPATGGPTPMRIQSEGAIGNYTASLPMTFDNPTTSGNQLVVTLIDYYPTDGSPFSITDNKGNTWKTAVDYADGAHIVMLYAENITGGAGHTVTILASGPTYFNAAAVEYSGLASTGSLDVTASNRGSSANYTSGAITLSAGNELLFGVHRVPVTGVTLTPASSWSTVTTLTNYDVTEIQDQIAALTGSYASSGTESSANDTTSVVAAFKAAPSQGSSALSAPPNLTATPVTSSQINLTWNAASGVNGIAGYLVYRDGVNIGSTTSSSFSDNGLSPNTTYMYNVVARDTLGNLSTASTAATSTTVATGGNTVTWSNMTTPAVSPGYVGWNNLYTDPVSGQIILCAGANASISIFCSDMWAYKPSTNTWTEIGGSKAAADQCSADLANIPGERHPVSQMAIDSKRSFLWLYGGINQDCNGYSVSVTGNTVSWTSGIEFNTNNSWAGATVAIANTSCTRSAPCTIASVTDPLHLVLTTAPGDTPNGFLTLADPGNFNARQDMYYLKLNTNPATDVWQRVHPANLPDNGEAAMAYDSDDDVLILFNNLLGVYRYCPTLNNLPAGQLTSMQLASGCTIPDDWTLDSVGGTQPPGSCFTNIVYDPATHLIIAIGGASCDGSTYYGNQVWAYNILSKSWTQKCLACSQTPPANAAGQPQVASGIPGLAYNAARHTILFHQSFGPGAPADWEYNPSTDSYVKLTTIGGFTVPSSVAAGFDPISNTFVLWSSQGLIWQGALGVWQ